MQYVRLGKSGLQVSRICLGCMSFGDGSQMPWTLRLDESRPIFRAAVDNGVNFFDTADVYSKGSSEEYVGTFIREMMPRYSAVIATKVFLPAAPDPGPNDQGLSRKHIMDAIDASLRRLGTDYVDLYQIHRFDPHTPVEETMEALNDIVRAGKARYIGASSMHAYQFVQMQYVAELNGWTKFASMQNMYNMAWREEEKQMNEFCLQSGVGLIPWHPLAGGFLASDWRETKKEHSTRSKSNSSYSSRAYETPEDYRVIDALKKVSTRTKLPMAQLALAWLLKRPSVTAPIVGATKTAHLEDAFAALDIALSEQDEKELNDSYTWNRALGLLS